MYAKMVSLIGQNALYSVEGLLVPVTITDVKMAYGTMRVEIQPINGQGSKWTVIDKVRVEDNA